MAGGMASGMSQMRGSGCCCPLVADDCNTKTSQQRLNGHLQNICDRTVFLQPFFKSPSINMIRGLKLFQATKPKSPGACQLKHLRLFLRLQVQAALLPWHLLLPQRFALSAGAARSTTDATTKPRSWTAANSSWTTLTPKLTRSRALARRLLATVCLPLVGL